MNLNFKEKVFVITGGAKGIGAEIATKVVEEEGIPVILDKDEKAAEALLLSLNKNSNSTIFAHKIDLIDSDKCQAVVERIVRDCGRIDGLINNAGVNDGIGLEKGSPEAFCNSIQKNLNHYYYMAYYCLPYLKERSGVILNIASKTAMTGQGNTSGYAAAKGGVLALTREWAVELLPYHIRVNAIIPAEVMTPLYRNWLNSFDNPEAKEKSITDRIPLGNRMTTAEEIANTAAFLLSEKASHLTGQHIHVDGGYVHLDRIIGSTSN